MIFHLFESIIDLYNFWSFLFDFDVIYIFLEFLNQFSTFDK